ncbi:MAG TPA: hypothetical protein VN372_04170 [Methanospirillum sp.]|nr:hypothetical protein [Methanospirillum sp.]
MTQRKYFISFLAALLIVFQLIAPVAGASEATMPDIQAPSFHPGLFTRGVSEGGSVPAVSNSYESTQDQFSYTPPSVSYSYFPGDPAKGEAPSIAGYVSGNLLNVQVNITGRQSQTEEFRYLATVTPDNRGIFVWPIPEWAAMLTEFVPELVTQ